MTKEFKEGSEAEQRGLMNDANPYPDCSTQRADWHAGFYGSLRDKREGYLDRMNKR